MNRGWDNTAQAIFICSGVALLACGHFIAGPILVALAFINNDEN